MLTAAVLVQCPVSLPASIPGSLTAQRLPSPHLSVFLSLESIDTRGKHKHVEKERVFFRHILGSMVQ